MAVVAMIASPDFISSYHLPSWPGSGRSSRISRCHSMGSVMLRYGLSLRISSSAVTQRAIISDVAVSFWRVGFSYTDSTVIRTCARPGYSHAG